jgi:hypothetical protein
MRRCLLGSLLVVLMAGCGAGPKFVPVSGRVTMNGKPLANAHVQFQPIGNDPGPGSYGATDADGRFKLKISSQQKQGDGAVVGKHLVRIGTILKGEGVKGNSETGSADDAPLGGKENIPLRYNQDSQVTFAVPPNGTTEANFDLTSP